MKQLEDVSTTITIKIQIHNSVCSNYFSESLVADSDAISLADIKHSDQITFVSLFECRK